MKLLIKSFFLVLFLSSVIFSQNISLSGRVGVVKAYGTAEGVEISAKRIIQDHFLFQLTTGYYFWSDSKDMNASYIPPLNNDAAQKEVNNLIPIRVGFSYMFGDRPSHPFFSIEWAMNRVKFDYHEKSPQIREYSETTLFSSLGFSMGFSFLLQENMNLLTAVVYQTGSALTYTGLIAGFEYDL